MRLAAYIQAAVLMPYLVQPVPAQMPVPLVVRSGLETLATNGYAGALRIWTRTWTDNDDSTRRAVLDSAFSEATSVLGPPMGYDIAGVVPIGTRVMRVYVVVIHQRQPVYLLLVAYRSEGEWALTNVTFDAIAERVLPPDLLRPRPD